MKKNDKPMGIIYVVKNKVTGDYYVGATTASLEIRKKDHIQKANKGVGHYFHDAITRYSPETFEWQQIDTAASIEELAKKERNYIEFFDAMKSGYCSDSGGGFKKPVFQYSVIDGSYINAFDSITEAAEIFKISKKAISRACHNINKAYAGFLWSYDLVKCLKPKADKRKREVLQLDMDGNIISKYISVAEASRQTRINKSSISKCCRGEREYAEGYIWIYTDNL